MATNLDKALFSKDRLGAEGSPALLGLPDFLSQHPSSLPTQDRSQVTGLKPVCLPSWRPNSHSLLCLEFSSHSSHGWVFIVCVFVTTLIIQRDVP